MTITDILALLFVIAVVVKLLALVFAQKFCYKKAKYFMNRPMLSTILSTILLVVVGYFLFKEMSTVQVVAAAWFLLLLESITFFTCSNLEDVKEVYRKAFMSKSIIRKNWFSAVVWLILVFWVLLKLFA